MIPRAHALCTGMKQTPDGKTWCAEHAPANARPLTLNEFVDLYAELGHPPVCCACAPTTTDRPR